MVARMMKRKTQAEKVIEVLKYCDITREEAQRYLRVADLASVIRQLRERGYEILTIHETENGKKAGVAYRLKKLKPNKEKARAYKERAQKAKTQKAIKPTRKSRTPKALKIIHDSNMWKWRKL